MNMNFQIKICILLLMLLAVLSSNALPSVSVERSTIKGNGTTSKITRYSMRRNFDSSGSNDARSFVDKETISKLLEELKVEDELHKDAGRKKQGRDKYKVYIKRKLKTSKRPVKNTKDRKKNASKDYIKHYQTEAKRLPASKGRVHYKKISIGEPMLVYTKENTMSSAPIKIRSGRRYELEKLGTNSQQGENTEISGIELEDTEQGLLDAESEEVLQTNENEDKDKKLLETVASYGDVTEIFKNEEIDSVDTPTDKLESITELESTQENYLNQNDKSNDIEVNISENISEPFQDIHTEQDNQNTQKIEAETQQEERNDDQEISLADTETNRSLQKHNKNDNILQDQSGFAENSETLSSGLSYSGLPDKDYVQSENIDHTDTAVALHNTSHSQTSDDSYPSDQFADAMNKKFKDGSQNIAWVFNDGNKEEYLPGKRYHRISTNVGEKGNENTQNLGLIEVRKLAFQCPECFKKEYAELLHKEQTGQIGLNELYTLQLFKDLAIFVYSHRSVNTDTSVNVKEDTKNQEHEILIQNNIDHNTEEELESSDNIDKVHKSLPIDTYVNQGQIHLSSDHVNEKQVEVKVDEINQEQPYVTNPQKDQKHVIAAYINEKNEHIPSSDIYDKPSDQINQEKALFYFGNIFQNKSQTIIEPVNNKNMYYRDLSSDPIFPEKIYTLNENIAQEQTPALYINQDGVKVSSSAILKEQLQTLPDPINDGETKLTDLSSNPTYKENAYTSDENFNSQQEQVPMAYIKEVQYAPSGNLPQRQPVEAHIQAQYRQPFVVTDSISEGESDLTNLPSSQISQENTYIVNGEINKEEVQTSPSDMQHQLHIVPGLMNEAVLEWTDLPSRETSQENIYSFNGQNYKGQTKSDNINEEEVQVSPAVIHTQLQWKNLPFSQISQENIYTDNGQNYQGQTHIPSNYVFQEPTRMFPTPTDQDLQLSEAYINPTNIKSFEVADYGIDSSDDYENTYSHLFTVTKLRNLIIRLEQHLKTENSISLSNFLKMLKLIMIVLNSGATEDNSAYSLWFRQLTPVVRYRLTKYVNSLIRRNWVQELMIQLHSNRFDLNILKHEKWVSHFVSWRNEINYDLNNFLDQPFTNQNDVQHQKNTGILAFSRPLFQSAPLYQLMRPVAIPRKFGKILRNVVTKGRAMESVYI